ncbi:MAG: endolytic transglycosylase MltG [Chloroflexota bacterium]
MSEKPFKRRARGLTCLFQFGLLGVALFGVVAAVTIMIGRWQATLASPDFSSEGAASGLNPAQRIYLESYLAGRAEQLRLPAGVGTSEVEFTIMLGETADRITQNLLAANLITDRELFLNYLSYYGFESRLVAGRFTLSPQLTIPQIAETLTQPGTLTIELRFLPGWRLEEMAHYLAVTTPARIESDAFLAIVQRQTPFDVSQYAYLANAPADRSLEGYLFPDTYAISTDLDAAGLVTMMLTRFDEQVTPAMRQAFGASGLGVHEAVTLASIVEREAVVGEERPLIAGVFHNRLRAQMFLQADPTVQYALGSLTGGAGENWWKSPLDVADLSLDSPYNTYQQADLPPGPIANPSLGSLQAVAEPAETPYLFFFADCAEEAQGTHLFSETYAEHQAFIAGCS